jgi:hypothetical protein
MAKPNTLNVENMKQSAGTAFTTTSTKIEGFAEDLGQMLGHARSKAEGWIGQRQAIVKNLVTLQDEVASLLTQLGHDAVVAGRRGRKAVNTAVTGIRRGPGRPAGSKNAIIIVGGKKRRKMSAEARAKISAAQKKRWAKRNGGGAKKK